MAKTKRQIQSCRVTGIRQALAIPPIIGLLLWLLLDSLFWPTQYAEITQWVDQAKPLEVEKKKQQDQILQWRHQAQDWADLSLHYQTVLAQFSPPIDASLLLGNISRLAQLSSIDIITLEWLPKQGQDRYLEAPFILRLKGRYTLIQNFFSQLSASSPTVVVSRISWQRMSLDRDVIVVDVEASQFFVTSIASTQPSN